MTAEPVPDSLIQETLDDLVVQGTDDWVMMSDVDSIVRSSASRHGIELSPADRIMVGTEVLRRALERGFTIPGAVVESAPGFVPWDLPPAAALERIDREWRAAGEDLEMGDVGWLANTPAGDVYAEDVREAVNERAGWNQ